MATKTHHNPASDVVTREKTEGKPPPLYRVVLLNDDFTPMDFVVWLIQSVFYKTEEEATQLMWDVHKKGRGVCGVYPYDIARMKVMQVKDFVRQHEHPLECVMEVE